VDVADWERAGLYDPSAPDAADRLELLTYLATQGMNLDDLLAAEARGSLHAALSDSRIRPGRPISVDEVSAAVGISSDLLRKVTLAAGVPLNDKDYREDDFETFRLFAGAAALFGEKPVLQFTRVMGSSLARIADAALLLFLVNIEGPLRQEGAGDLPLAQAAETATESLQQIPAVMDGLFRLHVQAAIARQRVANDSKQYPGAFLLAVGFVDLVGFTPFSQDLELADLADFVEEFESRANEVVVTRGGRVVKHIGDEVMFITTDPSAACEIALKLVESFAADRRVLPHAGIAFGPVVARGGDFYGSVVNIASRIADLAVPGELLVTEAVEQESTDDELEFTPAGRRMLKGFAEPVALSAVTRSRPAP